MNLALVSFWISLFVIVSFIGGFTIGDSYKYHQEFRHDNPHKDE